MQKIWAKDVIIKEIDVATEAPTSPYSGINMIFNNAFVSVQSMLILNIIFTFPTLDRAPPTEIKAEYIEYPTRRISIGV